MYFERVLPSSVCYRTSITWFIQLLIRYCYRWSVSLSYIKHFQKVSQSDLQAVKIRLGHFLEMFHVWEPRIKLLKFYNWSQWSCYLLHWESLFWGAINHCFGNKSQTDPSPCLVCCVSVSESIYKLQNYNLFNFSWNV